MKSKIIYAYIYDFLSIVFEKTDMKDIKNIILFGSVAKDSFDKNSDIDLFFDIYDDSKKKNIEETLKSCLKSFEVKSDKTWKLKGIDFPISILTGKLNSEMWKSLRHEIISSGISLFGKFETLPKEIKHYALFYFSLSGLKRKRKMKFLRKMFGYEIKKNKKIYKYKGITEKKQGKRLGTNTILVPLIELKFFKDIFKEFNITPKIIEIWTREKIS